VLGANTTAVQMVAPVRKILDQPMYKRNNNNSRSKSSQTQQLFILVLFQQHVQLKGHHQVEQE